MDRRRLSHGQRLNERFEVELRNRYSISEAFDELNRLYEAAEEENKDENAKAADAETKTEPTEAKAAPEDTTKAKQVLTQLKSADYANFVKILNSDGKSKAFLAYLKQHYNTEDDEIQTVKKANASVSTIKCSELVPTQQNISLEKSLGMIEEVGNGWVLNIVNNPETAFKDPTVTYAGKYIIDGHHRWSKAYALHGGDCTIQILDFPAIEGVTWEDMLKAAQLAIVAANPEAKLINKVGDDNMLTTSKEDIKKFFIETACDEVVEAMKAKGYGDTKEAIAERVGNNVVSMQSTSQPVSGAKPRAIMPQLDGDGAKGKVATPKLSKAVIDLTEKAQRRARVRYR